MARNRLHGETQKRRQKKRTRVLKLSESPTRVEATRKPMPYEASPELEGQDLEFLEAMRDAGVRRMPGAGGLPTRQKAIERAHFASDEQTATDFAQAMESLGVDPLDGPRRPRPKRVAIAEPEEREPPLAPKPLAKPIAPVAKARVSTTFESSPEDAALMQKALRDGLADFNAKFQGAPQPKPMRGKSRHTSEPEGDPDSELDLHGATQEQAIRRVQGFLLMAHRQKLRRVLIITGRGLGSGEQGSVLRDAVTRWLERNGGPYVRDFHAAPPKHGGEGALWIVMR